MTDFSHRRILIILTLFALPFRMGTFRLGGPELNFGPALADQNAWWVLELTQNFGGSLSNTLWLIALSGLFLSLSQVWLSANIAFGLAKENDLIPYWIIPALVAILPASWILGSFGNSPLTLLPGFSLLLAGNGLVKKQTLPLVLGVLLFFLSLAVQLPLPWEAGLLWGKLLQTPLFPSENFLAWFVPLGILGPLFPLIPLVFWTIGRSSAIRGLGALSLLAVILAVTQARYLCIVAPWFVLGLVGYANHLAPKWVGTGSPRMGRMVAAAIGLVIWWPGFLARPQDPYPQVIRGVAEVLAGSNQLPPGKIWAHWRWGSMILGLSHHQAVSGFWSSPHTQKGLGSLENAEFQTTMDQFGADYFLGSSSMLLDLMGVLPLSGEWGKKPPEGYPIKFEKDSQTPALRLRGNPNIYNIRAWHLSAGFGSEIYTQYTQAPHAGFLRLVTLSELPAQAPLDDQNTAMPHAALYKRVKGTKVQVQIEAGKRVLGLMPIHHKFLSGGKFDWDFQARAIGDSQGLATLHIPYASGKQAGQLHLIWEPTNESSKPREKLFSIPPEKAGTTIRIE